MSPDVIPWRPYGAGLTYGLTLALDVDINEYYCSSTAGAGFKVRLTLRKLFFLFYPLNEIIKGRFWKQSTIRKIVNESSFLLLKFKFINSQIGAIEYDFYNAMSFSNDDVK